jgi:hypothetical protein
MYTHEDREASWHYRILGKSDGLCEIEVTLLQAKEGQLGIDRLNGYSMVCEYTTGITAYPERDLSRCHGLLKEELQTIIITKLHQYIITNVGNITEEVIGLR